MTDTYIDYTEIERLREVLVGRKILSVIPNHLGTYHGTVKFVLDNGTVLTAMESDGGCACANGCFALSVAEGVAGAGVITSVDMTEEVEYGVVGDGQSTISIFVYFEGLPSAVKALTSDGGDNGYYGWGFRFMLEEGSGQ